MRFRESIIIDRLIDERRRTLGEADIDKNAVERRAQALSVLLNARRELDIIAQKWNPNSAEVSADQSTVVGDITVDVRRAKPVQDDGFTLDVLTRDDG